jgi:NAD-dependent deacetylase
MTTAGSDDTADVDDALITEVASWIGAARRVTVFTGAGISTDSGIPDFRGPNGVWTKNPAAEKASTLQHYLADPDLRRLAWRNRVDNPAWTAEPNDGHRALVALEAQGRLHALITQNIDGLHHKAGHAPEKVIEVHGTIWYSRCWTCEDRRPMHTTLDRVRAGEDDPDCLVCRSAGRHGILKSDTISFGQALVPAVIDQAMQVSEECDLFLAIGSSLSVYPAANTVPRARASGARVVIVNGEPTKMDRYADAIVRAPIGVVLPLLIGDA